MKNKMMRATTKVAALAMVASMFATVMPVSAAGITGAKDTMSRLAASTESTHTLSFTTPTLAASDTIVFTYTNFTDASTPDIAPACTGGAGFTEALSGNVLTLTADGAVTGAVTCTPFALTNPGSSGSSAVEVVTTIAGVGATTTYINLPIMDYDQVTITADIDPTMVFDLDVSEADVDTSSTYSVEFGAIAFGTPEASDDSTIRSIFIDLESNATGGAVVTVQSANGAMVSTSTSDSWLSATDVIAANEEHYGICVDPTITGTLNAGDTFTAQGVYATGADCDGTAIGMSVGAVSTTATDILSADGPISSGRAQIRVGLGVNNLTAAHPDYTDTLTFLATATY